ncbi:mib1 [Symbiodinium natans]|uniref:Mib1 protein n=1 Tax=Symbiodinium natans TaxID=878477 RepID=A0A812IDM7_9DINO|nr:mib1 [Symbiodinium natans]
MGDHADTAAPGEALRPAAVLKEFRYKDLYFKSKSFLHQYCADESHDKVDEVRELVKNADDRDSWAIEVKDGKRKVSAIHVATFYGRVELVRLLLEAKVQPNQQEVDGACNTPLHVAVWYGRPEVVQVLLDFAADPSIKDNRNFTPLHFAARLGDGHTVAKSILASAREQRLLERQDWTVTTWHDHRPAIQLAAEADDVACFEELLAHLEDTDANCDRSDSNTAKRNQSDLVTFVFKHRPEIASVLLQRYHELQVVRKLLENREVEIITQILRNSPRWSTVLDHLVKEPEQMLHVAGTYYDKRNRANFWKQNFTNRWDRMAFLCNDSRSLRHSSNVLNFLGGQDDLEAKMELNKKLKGTDGPAMAEVFVSVGLIPLDANLLADDKIMKALAMEAKQSLLDTKFVKAVLDDSWTEIQAWYFWHVFWALVQVAMTCVASAGMREAQVPAFAFVVLVALWLKRLLEETWQLFNYCCCGVREAGECPDMAKSPKSAGAPTKRSCYSMYLLAFSCLTTHRPTFHTFLDWVYLSISATALYYLWFFDPWPLRRSLIAFYFTLVWLSALYWLRGFGAWQFSEKLLPILWAMRDTGTFLIVVTFTFAAAVHSYFVLSIPRMPGGLYRAIELLCAMGEFAGLVGGRPFDWDSWVISTSTSWSLLTRSSHQERLECWSPKIPARQRTTPSSISSSTSWPSE